MRPGWVARALIVFYCVTYIVQFFTILVMDANVWAKVWLGGIYMMWVVFAILIVVGLYYIQNAQLLNATRSIEFIDLVHTKQWTEDMDKTCPTCYEDYTPDSTVCVLPCNHAFHVSCSVKWMFRSPTCPICRFDLSVAYEEAEEDEEDEDATT